MGNVQSEAELDQLMTRYDSVSRTYDAVMTYLICHFVPGQFVGKLAAHSGQNIINECMRMALKSYMNLQEGKVECMALTTGSTAEGLSLLQFHVTEDGILSQEPADVDTLMIDNVYVEPTIEKAIANEDNYYLDTSKTHPGFVRIRVVDPEKAHKELLVKRTENGNDIYYLSKRFVQAIKPDKSNRGPAATSETRFDSELASKDESSRFSFAGDGSVDIVYGVNLTEWPDFMMHWQLRQIEIPALGYLLNKNFGCYLVGAAHPLSQDPEIEWRISCSIPELILARELTVVHRQAYLTFKYLVKEITKGQKGIMTYHLKTTLLWTIEKTPSHIWREDNLAQCLYQLLDNFINFLCHRKLPNYFIPESNLFEHLSSDHTKTTVSDLMKLRQDPVGYLLKFQRRIRLEGHSIWWDHALEVDVTPYLDIASKILDGYKDYPESSLILFRECLFQSMLDIISSKVSEGDFQYPNEMMMFYLNLPAMHRCVAADLPVEQRMYSFVMHVLRRTYLNTGNVDIGFSFIHYLQKHLETNGEMTDVLKQRLTLLEAFWNQILAIHENDSEIADIRWDQSAFVFDSFNLERDDIITIAEYSCFFFQLWCRRYNEESDHSQVHEATKSLKLVHTLLLALEITPENNSEFQFYGIWKLLCYNITHFEPNLSIFLESARNCYIPHEIIALLANVLIVRKVLLPSIDDLTSQTKLACHCGEMDSEACEHKNKITDLQAFKGSICTLVRSAELLLYGAVMIFNARITNLNFRAPGDRQISKACVNFLLALSMMYAENWQGAFSVFANISCESLATDKIVTKYCLICGLLIAFNEFNELPLRTALAPISSYHGEFQRLATLRKILKTKPSSRVLSAWSLYNRQVDMASYGRCNVNQDPITLRLKLHEAPMEVELQGNEITIIADGTSTTYPFNRITDSVEDIFQQHFNQSTKGFADFSGMSRLELAEELTVQSTNRQHDLEETQENECHSNESSENESHS